MDVNGLELQGAVALTKHLALLASFYALGNNKKEYTYWWAGNGVYTELGAGRYGSMFSGNFFLYEAYAGLGVGNIHCDAYNHSSLRSHFIKPFIQPSIGFRGRIVEFAITPRVGLLHFTGYTAALTDPIEQDNTVAYFENRKSSFLFEPGFTFRVGFQRVKMQVQYTLSTFNVNQDGFAYTIGNQEYASIGLRYIFSKHWPRARK